MQIFSKRRTFVGAGLWIFATAGHALSKPATKSPPPPPPPPPPKTALSKEVPTHAPPPPPPPAPEDREFIVYFEKDSTLLNNDSVNVVNAAIEYTLLGKLLIVKIVGHSDSYYDEITSLKYSEDCAKVVSSALIEGGVPPEKLSVEWKGEVDLAVATGDGVSEPLNRRTTIDINFQN